MSDTTNVVAHINRFSYVRYDEHRAKKQELFKATFESLEAMAEELIPGRSRSCFLTHLEEAYMWVGKAIRDEQIAATNAAHEPTRG